MDESRFTAAAAGNKHYKGNPCKSCGHAWRYTTTGVCVACAKRYNNNYRAKVKQQLHQARGGA